MSEKKLIIEPNGWPCLIEDCPPGFFVCDEEQLCFKSEYAKIDATNGNVINSIEAFNSAGEYFCPRNIFVQPVFYKWE